jgi:hypothetical protein
VTAKLKTGLNIADASGADPDSTHSQLMKDHRRPGRPEGASIHSMNEDDDNTQEAGELPQYRDRDEARKPPPAAEKPPPMGEGPYTSPSSGMDYQNPGEGPRTDPPQESER